MDGFERVALGLMGLAFAIGAGYQLLFGKEDEKAKQSQQIYNNLIRQKRYADAEAYLNSDTDQGSLGCGVWLMLGAGIALVVMAIQL